MSWLAPTDADQTLVGETAERNPSLYRLALALGPALRVEPLLLRNARLRFVPQSDAGLESELWFSPLVSSRSARAVLVRPGVARALTDRLQAANTPFPFSDVWAFVEDQTRHWPPEERLEQALRQSARRGDETALRDGLRAALRQIAATSGDSQRRDLARWLKGALPALRGEDDGPVEIDLAARFAAATLGDPGGTLGQRIANGGALPDWLRTFVPSGKTSQLGLRFWPGVLECLPPEEETHRVDLGAPSPAPLHVRCEGLSNDAGRWEPCWPGRRIRLPAGCTSLTLTTLGGARYRLAAKAGQATPPSEAQGAAFDRPVLIAHQPEDAEAAERVARLLRSAGIDAALISQSSAADVAVPDDAVVLQIWTQAAHRRMAALGASEGTPLRGLVLRMDDAPLVPSIQAQEVINLSHWRGDPSADTAQKLLETIRGLSGKALKESEPQPKVEPVAEDELAVFVTYARADQPLARELSKRLQAAGLRVVLDDEAEAPANWQIMSERKLRAARCVLVLWSRAARDGAYLRDVAEWTVRNKKYLSAVLDDFASVPKEFGEYKSSDLRGWPREPGSEARFEWFLEDIKRFVTAGPQPGEPFELESARNAEVDDLLAELKDANTPPPRRLEIGDRLAEVGDPRRGVGLDANGIPEIDWVEIPAGPFLYGEEKRTRELPTFRIARYPVTNAQYQAFIDAKGYQEARWWRGLGRIEKPDPSRWPTPNRPRTNVSWFEAVAFCRWLSAQLRFEVRLPTELEWEKAARGTDGREYPWGDGYRSGYANVDEKTTKEGEYFLKETSAVGLYLHGASPYGALDMAGNVLEWCLNDYSVPENTGVSGRVSCVVRGGAWGSNPRRCRAAYRDRVIAPVARNGGFGFRVCCASPIE